MFRSIRWRILIPFAAISVLATLGLTLYISKHARRAYYDTLETHLISQAQLMANTIAPALQTQADSPEALDALAQRWAAVLDQRITIIAPDGTVWGESHTDRQEMENHLYRPEVQRALHQGYGSDIRYSRTLGYDLMYTAASIHSGEELLGIVRLSLSLAEIEANVSQLRRTILASGLLTALLAVLLALYIAQRTTAPILHLTRTVQEMAAGNLSARVLPTTQDEVGQLNRAFNQMAEHLEEKMDILAQEQQQLAVVLTTMADGVIITDEAGKVLLCNPAALRILGIRQANVTGRTFAQAVYNHQLIDLWQRCRQTGTEQRQTIEVGLPDIFLQAIITPLTAQGPPRILVIVQDLTQVRRLETVRRDFISNISHELRTPLASLKIVVETLQDGAIDDPPAARRFLGHMEQELETITQMVQELLELSRIESGKVPLNITPISVQEIIAPPLAQLRPQAARTQVTLNVALPDTPLMVLADADRIRQVVANLVHNAIKFTPTEGVVTVTATAQDDFVEISVADTGVGIPAADLPRIFERFYKADRARSGGGTGLGLAIAKHLVQAHDGKIWAESIEGAGSTFTFTLPLAPQET